MKATIFYGIALSDENRKDWLDGAEFNELSKTLTEKEIEDEWESAVDGIDETLDNLWNSYLFDDSLNKEKLDVKTGYYTFEDCRQFYMAIRHTVTETNEIEFLGHFVPDPPEWKTNIDKAIALVEIEIEKAIGHKCIIPTKGQIQWHLALIDD